MRHDTHLLESAWGAMGFVPQPILRVPTGFVPQPILRVATGFGRATEASKLNLIQLHEKRNLDLVLLAVALGFAGRIGERSGKGSLHGISQVTRRYVARTHITKRTIGIHGCENRALDAINTCLVHLPRRR